MALADNKVKIQALLAGINALPEAGSGEAPAPVLQEKAVTPTKTAQSVTPDVGYDGLSEVNVGAIPDEYITTTDATAAAGDILEGKTAYVGGVKVEGMIPVRSYSDLTPSGNSVSIKQGYYPMGYTQSVAIATMRKPDISVDDQGTITASVDYPTGYVTGGNLTQYKNLTTKAASTITPTTADQTAVAKGRYTTGDVVVAGDANLVPDNIKQGVSIFGVAGSYEGSGGGSSGGVVETCTVRISNSGNYIAVLYPTYENGMFTPNYASCNYGASPAPFDMPKGHVIYILSSEGHTYLDAENAEIIFNVTDGHAGLDIMGIRVTGDVTITE